MKKSLAAPLASLLLAAALPLTATAADGTLNFTGNVVATTCAVGDAGRNVAVTMPTVSTASLSTSGASAGFTPFNVALSDCPSGANSVRLEFNDTTNVDAATGRLRNTAVSSGTGDAAINPASNVQIALRNGPSAASPELRLGAGAQSSQVTVTGGSATIPLSANYVATGAATAGAVRSALQFSIIYQ